jgi:hypothetical protein
MRERRKTLGEEMMGWFKGLFSHPEALSPPAEKECCPITPAIILLLQDIEDNYADWSYVYEGAYKEIIIRNDKRYITIYKYLSSYNRWLITIPSGNYSFNDTETEALDDLLRRKGKEDANLVRAKQIAELTKRLTTTPTVKKEKKK